MGGRWDGDDDFRSSEIVLAFEDKGNEQGPRVAVVPEPTATGLAAPVLVPLCKDAAE